MSLDPIQHQKNRDASRHQINHELSTEMLAKLSKKKVPTTIKSDENQLDFIQQLLHQQNNEQMRQYITKRSIEKAQESGLIHNEELEEEINKALEKQFSPAAKTTDYVELSDQAQQTHEDNLDDDFNQPMAQFSAAKKATKKKDFNSVKKESLQEFVDDDEPDIFDKKITKTSKDLTKKPAADPVRVNVSLSDVKEYGQLLSQYVASNNPQTKQLLDRKRQHLLQKGLSTSQINHMAIKVGQVVKQHIVYDLKQKLIQFHMAKGFSSQSQIQAKMQFNSAAKQADGLQQLPHAPIDMSDSLSQLRHQAKQDLGNFLYEESINQFTKYSLNQISLDEFTEELKRLQKAAQSAGFQISEKDLTEKIIAAIDHLGLAEFQKPDTNANQQNPQQNRRQTQEEVLDDKLRYLYMMKSLDPSLRKQITTHFKIKKCKNGLIKLGFYTDEKNEHLKKQGEFLAVSKLKEELQFVFREEATLPHLTGPEYGILRKKQSFIINQIRKTSFSISFKEIQSIREASYLDMYSLIKEELLQLKEMAEIRQHVGITRKIKHLKEVVNRIKDSVHIHDFKENFNNLVKSKKSIISEHA